MHIGRHVLLQRASQNWLSYLFITTIIIENHHVHNVPLDYEPQVCSWHATYVCATHIINVSSNIYLETNKDCKIMIHIITSLKIGNHNMYIIQNILLKVSIRSKEICLWLLESRKACFHLDTCCLIRNKIRNKRYATFLCH